MNELKEACDAVIADPDLEPSAGVTHCNEGARRVAQAMGYDGFDDEKLMADDMVAILNAGGDWEKTDGAAAAAHALAGGLAFAAMSSHQLGEAHGHIAAIYPAPMGFSGSLNKKVPMVANVGKQDKEEKATEAFPIHLGEPDYFVLS